MVAAEVASRRVGGRGVIDVRCQQVSDAARHSLAADTDDAFPEFPPPAARDPLRVSEVFNRAAGVYTAQEKTKGVHLGPAVRQKRSASSAFEHVIAVRTDYGQFQKRMFGPACASTCPARRSGAPLGCLSKFGESPEAAAHHLFNYVCLPHVGDQATTHPRKRARVDRATGNRDMSDVRNKKLQTRWRLSLDQRLSDSVYYDPFADPDEPYLFDFKMPSSSGLMIPVCPSFFRAALAYNSDDRQWRNALHRAKDVAQEQNMDAQADAAGPWRAGPPPNDGRGLDATGLGPRGRNTLAWFASFIRLYSVPMPMRKELRIDFARKKHLYNHMKEQYALATGRTMEVIERHYFVGPERFYQYMENIGQYKVIADAVAERVGPTTSAGPWKLVFHDPQKKRDFKICGTCCTLAETRFGAVAAANAALFHQQAVYMDTHMLVVSARRNLFMANQRLAESYPNEHLTVIFDAMAHHALDGPVLSRHARLSKDTDSAHRMPVHLVGALTWGEGGQKTWCYFFDLLVQGGSNNTCEVLVRILESLGAADKLPKDPHTRVLHLQADNCGDNKNWVVLALCAVLVRSGVFTKIELDFLHVGHTHEVIDQVFAVIANSMRDTGEDLSTLPQFMAFVERLVKPVVCEELPGLRDFGDALGPLRVGNLAGHSLCYSFRFELGDTGKSVNMAYQADERLDAEWFHFDDWLSYPDDIGNAPLPVPAAPLNDYRESKLVDVQQSEDSGAEQVNDHFLHMIDKLNVLRSVVDPVTQQVHVVLSDDSAEYWRARVHTLCDPTALAARFAEVPTKLDFDVLLKDNLDLATLRVMQANRQVQRNPNAALLAGQRDGVFRDRNRRTITITNTALTQAAIGRANAADEVRENILWRRIHHEQRQLAPDTRPKVGELIAWAYPYVGPNAAPVSPTEAPVFLGVVLQVCVPGGPAPLSAVGHDGPVAHEFDLPTVENLGTLQDCHVLVRTYSPNQYGRAQYQGMQRLANDVFLEASFSPIIHPRRGSNDGRGEEARMERHWVALEDVVASTHILGARLRVSGPGADSDGRVRSVGQSFRLSADSTGNCFQRSRLLSALLHVGCAVAGQSHCLCAVCANDYDRFTGAAAPNGSLLHEA